MRINKTYNLVLIFSLFLIALIIFFQSERFLNLDYNLSAKNRTAIGDLPDFQFYDLSDNLITNNQFLKGRSLVIIHIDTGCDICSNKIKSLLKYIHLVEKTDIILSSNEDKNTLMSFYELNELKIYPQIHLVQVESDFFYKNFGSSYIPLILVFNQDGVLVKKIDDIVPVGTIIKYMKIANNEEIE